ncbi:MAG: M20/M25/M40 family metallo-hydrolase [Thermomonas sp.]
MIRKRMLQGLLLSSAFVGATAMAGQAEVAHAQAHSRAELASMHLEDNPDAKVYIVTSRATHDRVRGLVRNGVAHRDSLGQPLVIGEIRAGELSVLSEDIHRMERRCGGYFAFRTLAAAQAFLRDDRSAGAVARSLAANYTIDNQGTVGPWLSQAGSTKIQEVITQLQGYQNRYYSSPTGKTSAEWIRTTWQGLAAGRSDVTSELSTCANCSTQPSVILTIQGNELASEVVVIGAHLDSISGSGGNSVVAPGADDDASGIATITEVLRVALANGWKPKRTVKVMGYAAEEVGLRGSNAIATSFKNAGTNVVGVLQLDMTNYQSGSATNMRLITDYSNADLKTFFNQLFDAYLLPLGYTRGTYTCGYGCSDHASWTSAGFPAAMMFEAGTSAGGSNPNIHTTSDTLASMGNTAQPSVKFAQFALAFLGELAKTQGSTGGGGSGGALANGVAKPISGAAGSSQLWTLAVPAGSTGLKFVSAGGTGDADMYVKFGSAPTTTSYDCKADASGNAGTCNIATAQVGTYQVLIKAYTAFSGATLTGSYTTGGGGGTTQTYTNGTDVAIPDNNATGITSTITVSGRTGNAPSNTAVAVNIVHTYSGDLIVDLIAPDGTVYNLQNRTGGSADNVIKTFTTNLSSEAINGAWKLRVADRASSDTGYINSWSITM